MMTMLDARIKKEEKRKRKGKGWSGGVSWCFLVVLFFFLFFSLLHQVVLKFLRFSSLSLSFSLPALFAPYI